MISSLACPVCFQTTLSLKVSDKIGFANKLEVECSDCMKVAETYTSEKVRNTFDVNRRMVKHFVSVGQGFSAMENFCVVTNVEGLSNNAFHKHASSMSKLTVQAGEANLEKRESAFDKSTESSLLNQSLPPQMNLSTSQCLLMGLGIKGATHGQLWGRLCNRVKYWTSN